MSPAVVGTTFASQSTAGPIAGSLGGLLNKVSKVNGNGILGAAGSNGSSSSLNGSQWDTYRSPAQSGSPRPNGKGPEVHHPNGVSLSSSGMVLSPSGVVVPANGSDSSSSPPVPPSPGLAMKHSQMDDQHYTYTREFPPPLQPRDYTVLKEVGDGSFGTVWLADWHSPLQLPPGTLPPGPSSRPEYKGKQLVAVKRMKKSFEGGWDECMKLKELKSLRQIPMHPNIIPLYDAFLLPTTRELYFVFECMEGNLYQLTKSRKGRPLASGLTASIFYQILAGLHHIHTSGYFHRDMKPENLLITTTGLADYPASSLYALPGTPPEKDVVVVVKLADFGLAREIHSKPPYTEYVSTRWYRAPEVLLRSRDYSVPVDMWALGTIMVEAITLKPLFPGDSEVDQIHRICQQLGDPSPDYGVDDRGRIRGGGPWARGAKMAKDVGFTFSKVPPRSWTAFFDMNTVSIQLIDCIADLLRFEPKARLTAQQCLDSPYFRDIAPRFAAYPQPNSSTPSLATPLLATANPLASANSSSAARDVPPAHNHGTPAQYKPPFLNTSTDAPQQPNGQSAERHLSLDSSYRVHLVPPRGSGQYDSTMLAFPENVGGDNGDFPSPTPSSIYNGHHVDPSWGRTPTAHNSQLQQQQAQAIHQQQQQQQQTSHFPAQPHHNRPIPAFGTHVRRGSFGSVAPSIAASTFYDGSIFEGIAPTRASSIMSFPVSYGIMDPHNTSPSPSFPDSPVMMDRDNSQDSFPAVVGAGAPASRQQRPSPAPAAPAQSTKSGRWGFFGGDKSSSSSSSQSQPANPLKRTPSNASSIMPASEMENKTVLDPKKAKKEAEKAAKEAERLKREMLQAASRERARAVMKKKQMLQEAADPLHNFSNHTRTIVVDKGKARASDKGRSSRVAEMPQIVEDTSKLYVSGDMRYKARRRDDDDDVHSVSSNETGHSSQRGGRPVSIWSQATSASDPERRHPWPENEVPRGSSLSSIPNGSQSRQMPGTSYSYGPAAPNTGHSSLDLATRMQGLQTSSSERADSRGHRSTSPAQNDRFSPYSFHTAGTASRGSGQSLPPIGSFDHPPGSGHMRQSSQATQGSIGSYRSTPGSLPSHHYPNGGTEGPTLAPILGTPDLNGVVGQNGAFPYQQQQQPTSPDT